MAEVTWAPQAFDDLESIRSFISRDSDLYARLVIRRLIDAVERLREFPESGRVVPELENPAIREIIWRGYRIVYRLKAANSVEIATVFHGALPLDSKR